MVKPGSRTCWRLSTATSGMKRSAVLFLPRAASNALLIARLERHWAFLTAKWSVNGPTTYRLVACAPPMPASAWKVASRSSPVAPGLTCVHSVPDGVQACDRDALRDPGADADG